SVVPHNKAQPSGKFDTAFENEDIRKLIQTFSYLPESKRNRQRDAYTSLTSSPKTSPGPSSPKFNGDRIDFRRAKSSDNDIIGTTLVSIPADQPSITVSSRYFPTGTDIPPQCLTNCETPNRANGIPAGSLDSSAPPAYDDTDWGQFQARIAAAPDSATYEDLLLLEEFSGPAGPSTQSTDGERIFNVSIALVEVINRRMNKDGKAKLKLAVAGTRVD
ncbi:11849_t:CDS:2, partial [Acaulospora colombiana]